ncbi:MAG: glycoside hydrolase family 28 protein [Gemmatimonadetes bacterium]|nr:glycoside hydrolase family 28 protein [Gemmatimonadota bacterium]
MVSRRECLRAAAAGGAGRACSGRGAGCASPERALRAPAGPAGWERLPDILRRIRPPVFPDRTFDIVRFGALGDGGRDCTAAIRQAVLACHAAGGGRVLVPAGRYLTGPVHLRSNVELHLADGATLAFSQDPAAYLPLVHTRWEGVELMHYSPLIYAFEQENIAVTGPGTLDGQADAAHWWPWNGRTQYGWQPGQPDQRAARTRLMELAEQGVPVAARRFGEGSYLRPQFIQPYRCRNVLIEGVRISNSPMWEIHPVLCRNVTVRSVSVVTHGPNNDGCDPESCTDVLIEDCLFDTGDDCIAIKSGRNADGRRLATPTENVVVRGCRMKDGHGGVTIGSEISGHVRWVFVERCTMDGPNLDRALRFKNNAMRGGVLEHIYMRNVQVGQVAEAVVHCDFTYEEGAAGSFRPVVRAVFVEGVTSQRSEYALFLRGIPGGVIEDVVIADCDFRNVARGNLLEHVRGLRLENVSINGRRADREVAA